MSYINDALRKAQRERDNRYGKFGGIIAACPGEVDRFRKRRVIFFAAAAVILLVSTILLLAVRTTQPPPPAAMAPQTPAAEAVTPPAAAAQAEPKSMAPASGAVRPPGGVQVAGEADLRYGEALLAQRRGDLPRAEELYRSALTLDSGHVRALNNLGVVYMEQKQREKAVAVLGRAIALKKDYIDPYYNMACLHAQANEVNESLRYLKIAVTIDGAAINWAKKDADMKNVVASPEFKKLMEGQKN